MQASFQRLFPNISNPHKFGFSCLILENKVLMHQCAISAKDINLTTLNIEFWILNFFIKKRKQVCPPLLLERAGEAPFIICQFLFSGARPRLPSICLLNASKMRSRWLRPVLLIFFLCINGALYRRATDRRKVINRFFFISKKEND